ncbi:PAS domain-containing sensor histidine kinase [Halorubrum vacuolatum]|uniref:histidine kinase n=1 Tax=Halorubrum vacuolatum TaxID=63740 RepID=A0A238X168_HALVU|nr:ATP-binding protein [Halorubrum vacuolatum]SNR52502.1 PAS domain S-box-containing protein [Halorubrum vacuolatum]
MRDDWGLLDGLPDPVLVVDGDGIVRFANAQVEQTLGYAPEKLEGDVVESLLHPEDAESHASLRETYMRDPQPRSLGSGLDLYALRADGTEVPVSVSLGPFEHDGETYILTTVVDVSTERAREVELQRRTHMLTSLHRATQDLLKTTDRDLAAEAAVTDIENVLDLPLAAIWLHDDANGTLRPAAWTDAAAELVGDHPTFDLDGETLIARAFRAGEPHYVPDTHDEPTRYNPETPVRCEFIVPLGRYGVLSVSSPEPDALVEADQAVARLWGATITMVFVRIEREQQLRSKETDIAHERDRLEEFASVVSHDLRNPLTVAAGRLQLVREEHDSEDLQAIDRSLTRMEAIIEDVLTLARQGDGIDEVEPVQLAGLAEECWTNVDTERATLSVAGDVTISADRSRLAQVLENLFRNAIEHGMDDGATDGEGDETIAIEVGPLPDGDGFYVADDGDGIDPRIREEVFEPGMTTNPDGTGFGLRIVAEIARAHGWSVSIADAEAGGARFEFRGVEFVDASGRVEGTETDR